MDKTKRSACLDLVLDRKECRRCQCLTNPSVSIGGAYDSDEIGPWSGWHGNLSAKLMIVGQDWGSERYFVEKRGIEDPNNSTNKVLAHLVRTTGLEMEAVFLTNAILCLKGGSMQAPVKKEWFVNCGELFLKKTIEIVKPKILVTLGEHAYRSMEMLFGLRRIPFREAVDFPEGIRLPAGIRFFPVYHCSARIRNTHRRLDQQERDWLRIKPALS